MTIEPQLEQALEAAARAVVAARYVVALVGAGISVESGIPPFRGPGGLWTKFGEPDFLDYERFREDPKKWWEDRISRAGAIQELIDALSEAKPNAAHFALADLFKGTDTVYMLKMREIYRHLSNAADRGDEAANIISSIVMKHT